MKAIAESLKGDTQSSNVNNTSSIGLYESIHTAPHVQTTLNDTEALGDGVSATRLYNTTTSMPAPGLQKIGQAVPRTHDQMVSSADGNANVMFEVESNKPNRKRR